MANRYWVGGTGTWNTTDTTHWSATSGGAGGASVPTSADDVYFNASSFSASGQTVTVPSSVTVVCRSMIWTGAANSPTLSYGNTSSSISVYGSLTLISAMAIGGANGWMDFYYNGSAKTITTAGVALKQMSLSDCGSTVTLQDNLTAMGIYIDTNSYAVTFNSNNKDITLTGSTADMSSNGLWINNFSNGATLNLGTSTVTTTGFYAASSDNTVNASTANLYLTAQGAYNNSANVSHPGTKTTTWNSLTCLYGACGISGNTTISTVVLCPGVTFSMSPTSYTYTFTNISALHATIKSTTSSAATITSAGDVSMVACNIANITGTGGAIFRGFDCGTSGTNSGLTLVNTHRVNIGAAWKGTGKIYCNIAGWKTGDEIHSNIGGVWKLVWPVSIGRIDLKNLSVARYTLAAATVGSYALFAGGQNTATPTYYDTVDAFTGALVRSTPTVLTSTRTQLHGVSIGNYALFVGGTNGSYTDSVNAYDASLTRSTPTALSLARGTPGAVSNGTYAILAGGIVSGAVSNVVDAYNTSLTRSTPTVLSVARNDPGTAVVGEYMVVAGGAIWGGRTNVVDAYNASLTRSTPTVLSAARNRLAGASNGTHAIFVGGAPTDTTASDVVDAYNSSLTRSIPTVLSQARGRLEGLTTSALAIFAGGENHNGTWYNVVNVYNRDLTRLTASNLSVARSLLAAAKVGDCLLFAGGCTASNTGTDAVDVYTLV